MPRRREAYSAVHEVSSPGIPVVLFCGLDAQLGAATTDLLSADAQHIRVARDMPETLRELESQLPDVVVVGGHSHAMVAASCRRIRLESAGRDAVLIAVTTDPLTDTALLLDAGIDEIFVRALGPLLLSRSIQAAKEKRSSKRILREAMESLTTTLNSMWEGVISMDASGLIDRMNPAAVSLTGWTLTEALGASVRQVVRLVNGTTRKSVENPFDHAQRRDQTVFLPRDTVLVCADGREIPISDSCAPIRSTDGTFAGAVLVFRDLTAQREAEAGEARAKAQAFFSERMASLGVLAAGVAHEINNPLCYMLANVELSIEQIHRQNGRTAGELADVEEMLIEASGGISRIAKIVHGLKSLSRHDDEDPQSIDLLPVLELSINTAMNEIRYRATLIKDFRPVPLVMGDDVRLGQVFLNLLINAAQAFLPGNREANVIRVTTSTDALGRAVVEIFDNGPGIPSAILERVFEPFFTTKSTAGGTGLGLSVSHSIVTGMGGEITVTSVPGSGTTFVVSLPAASALSRIAPAIDSHQPAAQEPSVAVLVVDDEQAIGNVIRRSLPLHDVTVATSAQDALALLATGKKFDLILTDLMMPGMSGIELFKEIAAHHPALSSKVVFMSGGAFTPEGRDFLVSLVNERLEKPFSTLQLRDMVQAFVR